MSQPAPALDPITLEIIWNGLKSIADKTWVALKKSAYSTNIKERHDHSTAIADARGRLIAQAEMSLPIHLASMLDLMRISSPLRRRHRRGRHLHRQRPARGRRNAPARHQHGDAGIRRRPAGGVRVQPRPPRRRRRHRAGTMSGGMSEIYQEGLRIPVMRLFPRRARHRAVRLLLLNMRLPAERRGDLNAQIAACRLGVERMQQLFARYGTHDGRERLRPDSRPHGQAHARRHRALFPTAATASRTCSTTTG